MGTKATLKQALLMLLPTMFFFAAFTSPTLADQWDCKSLTDTAARLKCYDAAAESSASKEPESKASSETTSESSTPPTDAKVVDPIDLSVGSGKYYSKNIEVRGLHCYYADVGDYRCTGDGDLAIFARSIEPNTSQTWIDDNCDQVKKAILSSKCKVAIRFKFGPDDISEDLVSGYRRRKIIRPPNAVWVALPEEKRRRRR